MSIADRLLTDIDILSPSIAIWSEEIDEKSCIPDDLLDALRAAGVFLAFVPKTYGGLELELPEALRVFAAISRIDASVGWVSSVLAGANLISALLPRAAYDHIHRETPDALGAGATRPTGRADKIENGWRVNGRWAFASGCKHADWLFGVCVLHADGRPMQGADGRPLTRGVLLPAAAWSIEETWHVQGLRGTGSHHFHIADTHVPDGQLFDLGGGTPCVGGPLFRAVREVLPLLPAAVMLGIAEGALDDLVAIVRIGRQPSDAPAQMQGSESFQATLGCLQAELRAAQALLAQQAEAVRPRIQAGTASGLDVEIQQASVWIGGACVRVTDACFGLAGSEALHEPCLQRRLRDIHVAAEHAAFQPFRYARAGSRLLQEPPPLLHAAA